MSFAHPQYVSTAELARFLGISTVAVFKRIKNGRIKAEKIGRSYAIPRRYVEQQYPDYPRQDISTEKYLSLIEAAALLGVSRMTVYNRIKSGQIPAKRVGRHYVVAQNDLVLDKGEGVHVVEAPSRDYVSIMELAEIIGSNRKTLFNQIQRGLIKARKVGRHYVIAREDIPQPGFAFAKASIPVEAYCSVAEAAQQLGISRVAVFKKIKKGQIKAERMGRSYAIPKSELDVLKIKKSTPVGDKPGGDLI